MRAEDGAVGAAAVLAEDAGEVEGCVCVWGLGRGWGVGVRHGSRVGKGEIGGWRLDIGDLGFGAREWEWE